jgi:hypothetical protein
LHGAQFTILLFNKEVGHIRTSGLPDGSSFEMLIDKLPHFLLLQLIEGE